ncbi:hypothetical protein [Frateuria sp. Soil773]|uniref:hypothetical protein n=1 Tax=Frateuria sp. Soil773 TaxID=1736407 RepID=UPI0012FA3550|nr:hypothetical protein [Frateuria sp. Soil773]
MQKVSTGLALRNASGKEKAGSPDAAGLSGLFWMPLGGVLVEVAGVEPASEGA